MFIVFVGLLFLSVGLVFALGALVKFTKAVYYFFFYTDKAYENEVLKKTKEYKEFTNSDIFKDGV